MKKEQKSYIYTVWPNSANAVTLWLYSKASKRVDNTTNVYLQGDDAALFLKEVKDTEDVWENGTDMTKEILKKTFGNIENHVSYIISMYF
jgi:hypothetical protein